MDQKKRASAASLSPLAAILPEVIREAAKRVVFRRVVVEGAFGAARQEIGVDEALQMMAQRRGGHVDVRLDVARGRALRPRLNDEAENPQAHRMPEGAQLFGVPFQFHAHATTSNIFEPRHKPWPRDFLRPSAGDDVILSTMTNAAAILDYWFSTLDDGARLDRAAEPFRTCYQRWYGKDPAIDAEIRARFEPVLLETTRDGRRLNEIIEAFREAPSGLLALLILLDQLPRNMYRNTPGMYAHDPVALAVALAAIREHEHDDTLPTVRRMFLYVPLMHVESLTMQQYMLAQFDDLLERARTTSPQNMDFFELARDYARRHVDVVAQFGRFPHRNEILGRQSTAAEKAFLVDNPGF
jgi:uncharacterized protein (DUF924 family)